MPNSHPTLHVLHDTVGTAVLDTRAKTSSEIRRGSNHARSAKRTLRPSPTIPPLRDPSCTAHSSTHFSCSSSSQVHTAARSPRVPTHPVCRQRIRLPLQRHGWRVGDGQQHRGRVANSARGGQNGRPSSALVFARKASYVVQPVTGPSSSSHRRFSAATVASVSTAFGTLLTFPCTRLSTSRPRPNELDGYKVRYAGPRQPTQAPALSLLTLYV